MFDPAILAKLVDASRQPFARLIAIEDQLNRRFHDLREPIRALILSVASGEPLLLIGPPGTAKSRLIRAFCGLIGLLDEDNPDVDHPDYFEYLLTPFTEPGELFGFYNIAAARESRLVRDEAGMMQNARVIYLDEVFNGSSAILNSILAFLNERIFHDRGLRKRVAMQCLFAATNRIPETPDLRAIFDRFVLRCRLDNVPSNVAPISKLLTSGWRETFSRKENSGTKTQVLDQMERFREGIRTLTSQGLLLPQQDHPFHRGLTQLIHHARQYDLSDMSNRRLVKMTYIMLVHCVYEAVLEEKTSEQISMGAAELQLLPRYFLDRYDEEAVRKMKRTVAP